MRPCLFSVLRWIASLPLFMIAPVVSSTAATAVLEGQWSFVDDGTVIEVATCPTREGPRYCGVIVRLPSSAKDLAPGEKKLLCGAQLLGDLRSPGTGNASKPTYRGWIIDPDDLPKTGSPTRYDATLTVTSAARAVIEVRVVGWLFSERYDLARNVAPVQPCGER